MEFFVAFIVLLSSAISRVEVVDLSDLQAKNPGCDPAIHTCSLQ